MLGTFSPRPHYPNMNHPLNRGRLVWWVPRTSGAQTVLTNIMPSGTASLVLPHHVYATNRGSHPGAIAPAYSRTSDTLTVSAGSMDGRIHHLTTNPYGAGFSVAYWVYHQRATDSGPMLAMGNTFQTGNSPGWGVWSALNFAGFYIGRATARQAWELATDIPLHTWRRVLISWVGVLGTSPRFWVDGVERVNGITQTAGSGALNPETPTLLGHLINIIGNFRFLGRANDVSVWDHALSPAEALMDWQETSTGYPGALMRPSPYNLGGAEVIGGSAGFTEGVGLGSQMTLQPEVSRGIGLGVSFFLPDLFKHPTEGFALGSSFQSEDDLLPRTVEEGFALGAELSQIPEVRQGFALGSDSPLTVVDPEATVSQGFALGSRFTSQSGDLANDRYRR